MRNLRTILAVVFAAFLVLWAVVPAAHASSLQPLERGPQMSFDHDSDEGQDADDDEDDEDGDADDDNELISQPVFWTPQVAMTLGPQAAQQLLAQGNVKTVPGLASPAAIASNGLLLVANGPTGPLAVPAPPYDRSMTWGSFGTYDNWASAFMAAHAGKAPTIVDEVDFWASQAYAGETGISPFDQPLGFITLQPPRPENRINTPD